MGRINPVYADSNNTSMFQNCFPFANPIQTALQMGIFSLATVPPWQSSHAKEVRVTEPLFPFCSFPYTEQRLGTLGGRIGGWGFVIHLVIFGTSELGLHRCVENGGTAGWAGAGALGRRCRAVGRGPRRRKHLQ